MKSKSNFFSADSSNANGRALHGLWLFFASLLLLLPMWLLAPTFVIASAADANSLALVDDAGVEPPLNRVDAAGAYSWSTPFVALAPQSGEPKNNALRQTTATTSTHPITATLVAEDNGAIESTGEVVDEPAGDAFAAWNNRDAVTRAEAYPVRLRIPALAVDAHVEQLGERVGGEMATPTHPSNVGWYRYGAIPGENGNMVMAGHLDRVDGSPAVFWELEALTIGDAVVVQDSTGTEYHYVVTEGASYPYNRAPIDDIFGFGLVSRLNLITCRGEWDRNQQNYSQRYVVYTELVKIVEP